MLIKLCIIIVIKKSSCKHLHQISKILVLFSTIFIPVINNINKKVIFKNIFYIYYLIQFHEDKIRALLNSDNKINTINLDYTQNWVL